MIPRVPSKINLCVRTHLVTIWNSPWGQHILSIIPLPNLKTSLTYLWIILWGRLQPELLSFSIVCLIEVSTAFVGGKNGWKLVFSFPHGCLFKETAISLTRFATWFFWHFHAGTTPKDFIAWQRQIVYDIPLDTRHIFVRWSVIIRFSTESFMILNNLLRCRPRNIFAISSVIRDFANFAVSLIT